MNEDTSGDRPARSPRHAADPTRDEPQRQTVQKHGGRGRRARLTAVEGTDTSPDSPVEREEPGTASGPAGPNDERLKRDRPPHW